MTDIPLSANVQCTDGPCGKSTNVILNPVTHKVSHFVVQDKKFPRNPTRLVPIGNVTATTPAQITLSCTIKDVEQLPPFKVTDFVQESPSGGAWESGAVYTFPYVINDTAYDAVEAQNIPADEIAVVRGMQIEATDGKVGKLDELVLDPNSGEVTHLLMRSGHLWGKKEVTIPISAVDFTDGEVIYLNVDEKAVGELPTVPVKR